MNVLFFKGEEGSDVYPDHAEVMDTADDDSSDQETVVFDPGIIVNIDRDSNDQWTLYTQGGHFYFTLSGAEMAMILAASGLRVGKNLGAEVRGYE